MICPNCDREVNPENPTGIGWGGKAVIGHGEDCMLRALLKVIEDRDDHILTGIRIEAIDINNLWDRIGPVADAMERELDLTIDLNNPGPRGKEKIRRVK